MNYVIVDHHRDAADEVYILTIGTQVETHVQAVDENGAPVFERVTLTDQAGNPMLDKDGQEIVVDGDPVMELDVLTVPIEDFAFAAFDERWEGLSPDEIAKQQRRLVRAALRKREETPPPRQRDAMPGVGDPL